MAHVLRMENVSCDPVLAAFELPLRRTFYPYGFPLQLETNSADVIAAAAEGWDQFQQAFDQPAVRLHLGVLDTGADPGPIEPVIRSRENMMSVIADPHNFLICDFDRGFGFGWVASATAADHPSLRYHFLLAGGATLVEQRAFAAMHGALVARDGKGVMLAGDSFAGKSTLAYACARSGWTYVSDDAAYLVRGRGDRYAVGDPHSIRFRVDAPELFPELADRVAAIRPNGKIAIEIRTRDLLVDTAPGCHIEHIVYLTRDGHSGAPALRKVSQEFVREDCSRYNVFGTEETMRARRRCYEHLLSAQLWEMRYSGLDDAVAALERLVDRGGDS